MGMFRRFVVTYPWDAEQHAGEEDVAERQVVPRVARLATHPHAA